MIRASLEGCEDAVGYGSGFGGGADVVDAEDVSSGEDGRSVCSGGGMEAGFGGRWVSLVDGGLRRDLGEGVGKEAFA